MKKDTMKNIEKRLKIAKKRLTLTWIDVLLYYINNEERTTI
tara:strand:+ start:180 stop:302 length:123 start_codon:yes stop_codon:yes gene_type:complete